MSNIENKNGGARAAALHNLKNQALKIVSPKKDGTNKKLALKKVKAKRAETSKIPEREPVTQRSKKQVVSANEKPKVFSLGTQETPLKN